MPEKLDKYRIILASQSPRRQELLKGLGLNFETIVPEHGEEYPSGLKGSKIARYLSEKKALSFDKTMLDDHTILITADTIVWLDDENLGKPAGYEEASEMLRKLSGRSHEVITGVSLRSLNKLKTFTDTSRVFFKKLTPREIEFYIQHFRPFDKAGAYGIQEWIGYIAITRIEGSYFNVMGLPVQQLYEELLAF
jgi:septum formation protein